MNRHAKGKEMSVLRRPVDPAHIWWAGLALVIAVMGTVISAVAPPWPTTSDEPAPTWDLQSDGSYKIHRPAPASAPAPVTQATNNTHLDRPIYLRKGAVICPPMDVFGAYLDGYKAGGEHQGHQAVEQLFVHPDGDCVRTLSRDRVKVTDQTVSAEKLVHIEWEGMPDLALSGDLSN